MRAPFQIHEKQNIKLLPPEIKTEVACTGKKIRTCFNVKYQSKFDHQHDVVYYAACPNKTCRENYLGQSSRRVSERIKDHNGRNLKSCKRYYDFKIIVDNFNNNSWERKTDESFLVKGKRPPLNIHGNSVPLKLFN